MKGYYTVQFRGPGVAASRRVELETRFAKELEALLGGAEAVRALCLAAAGGDAASLAQLQGAREQAANGLQVEGGLAAGDFSVAVWQAVDL